MQIVSLHFCHFVKLNKLFYLELWFMITLEYTTMFFLVLFTRKYGLKWQSNSGNITYISMCLIYIAISYYALFVGYMLFLHIMKCFAESLFSSRMQMRKWVTNLTFNTLPNFSPLKIDQWELINWFIFNLVILYLLIVFFCF